MKTGAILIVFVLFVITGLKANQVTDSLEILLSQTQDTSKVDILCELCWQYRFISAEKALEYGEQALALSTDIGYDKGIAQSYNDIGILFIDQSEYQKAIDYFEKSLVIRKQLNDKPGIASLYNKIGIVNQKQGKLKEALKNQIEALKIYEELQQDRWISYSFNNIAIIHQNLGNLNESLKYHEKALDIRIKMKDSYGEGMSYGNLANVYVKMDDTASALEYYLDALKIFRELENDEAVSTQLSNLGNIYLAKGQLEKAMPMLKESLAIREQLGDQKGIASSLIKIGEVYTNLGQYQSASKALYRGLLLAIEVQVVEEEMAAQLIIAKMYALQHQLDSAFLYTQQYIDLKDSIYDQRLKQQIVDVQVKYETEKVEQDNAILKSKNELNEARLKQRQTEILLLVFAIFSLAGMGLFFYYRFRQKQKLALDAAIIHQKELRINAVLDGQEEERRRIARELHDGVGQKLAGIKLNWEGISGNLINGKQFTQMEKMAEMLDGAANEVRTLSHQMMPKELEQFGLIPAFESTLDNSLKNTSIRYNFDHFGLDERLPESIELNLFRIFQELTSNVIRHSEARNFHVQLLSRNDSIVMLAEDDGKGFSANENDDFGIGLMNIESRVEAINATMDIESENGKGTTIRIRTPLNGRD